MIKNLKIVRCSLAVEVEEGTLLHEGYVSIFYFDIVNLAK